MSTSYAVADLDSLTAKHLKYSHHIMSSILTKRFNLILSTSKIPVAFGDSYIVPLWKLQGKDVTTDDFGGIAIHQLSYL